MALGPDGRGLCSPRPRRALHVPGVALHGSLRTVRLHPVWISGDGARRHHLSRESEKHCAEDRGIRSRDLRGGVWAHVLGETRGYSSCGS